MRNRLGVAAGSGYIRRMFQHLIWDWNGTLLDDVDACVASLNDILRGRHLREVSRKEYCDTFRFPVRDYYIELGFDFEQDDWDQVAGEYHVFYREHARNTSLRTGVMSALECVRADGVTMSILSACEIETLERMVTEHNIRDFFVSLHGRPDHYAGSKVDVGRAAMRKIESDPSTTLLVGDTTHDYEVAEALGCRCLLVCGGHQSEDRLRDCGCDMVGSIGLVEKYLLEGR